MSAFKTLMNIIFPLITFPYASNVLQVENLGKVNFASSVCGYFLLFAGLGISSYAVREGSRYVNDREKLSAFASEMFSINMISTALTYAVLAVTMLFWTKLHAYTDLMLVLSLQIFFTTIGTEWVFTIFEEYTYITIRGLLFQVLSIFMLFAFVKTRDDYCIYAGITVFAAVGANVLNFFRARRYCTIRLTRKIDWKKHLKPILIIFASTLATTLYVSSDTTILGILGTDYNVGIYSVAGKIYGIVKNLLSAVLVVSIPRLSHYAGVGDKVNFNKLFNNIFNALIVVVAPAVVGLFALSREVVLFISGESYLDALMPLPEPCPDRLSVWLAVQFLRASALRKRKGTVLDHAGQRSAERGAEHPAHPAVPGECGSLYHPAGRAVLHDALYPLLQGSGHGLS